MELSIHLQISALYTGLLLILIVALALNVVRWRRSAKVSLGDGDHRELRRAIRAHANAVEHIPTALIGLVILEALSISPFALHLYGSLFFISRALHAIGLIKIRHSANLVRQIGVALSWLIMLAMAIHLIALSI